MMPGTECRGVIASNQDERRLNQQVDRQESERAADQAQCPALPVLSGAGQLPQDNRRGTDLDEGVHAEPGQGNRPRRYRRDRQDDHADDIPAQGDVLQRESAPQELPAVDIGLGVGHR